MGLLLLQSIKAAAKRDARAFAEEFGLPLDPTMTDWGRDAFGEWEHGLTIARQGDEEIPAEGIYSQRRINGLRLSYEALVARYTQRFV